MCRTAETTNKTQNNMIETCPKCAYVRKENDEAPEWQCPACGIAMAKYIALQKEKAERKLPPPTLPSGRAPGQFEVMKPQPALGLLDDGESLFNRGVLRVVRFIFVMMVVAAVRYMMAPHKPAPTDVPADVVTARPLRPQPSSSPLQPAPQPTASPAAGPQLPVDTLKDFFQTAHQNGDVDGVMMVTADSYGVRGLNYIKPVKVHVERREALARTGCDRFGVTLTQGGGEHSNTRGQTVKEAYSMYLVYALNYCLDGTTPVAGRDLKIETEQ